MDKALNKEILRLSLPSILANITVPLVGLVDTAIAGHIHSEAAGASSIIGAISIASMIFTIIYWNFGFLRTGTGGLTAQSFGGKRPEDSVMILSRGLVIALVVSLVLILLQWPICQLGLLLSMGSSEAESLAAEYFYIRIWAAPATLSLMVFSGWFVGLQDSMSSMWKDLIINGVNVVASFMLALGVGNWEGMGIAGIALGTVIAQYCGLAFCIFVSLTKHREVVDEFELSELKHHLKKDNATEFISMNKNLFKRSLYFTGIYVGFTLFSTMYGDTILACSTIMMQLLMLYSYFIDGFAYAGEALSGRFIGAKDSLSLEDAVKQVFYWAAGVSAFFILAYYLFGGPVLKLMTDSTIVLDVGKKFLPWLLLMPVAGCLAFTWDGIYLGATASRPIYLSMKWAFFGFMGTFGIGALILLLCKAFIPLEQFNEAGLHILLGAYFVHLAARSLVLQRSYKREVMDRAI